MLTEPRCQKITDTTRYTMLDKSFYTTVLCQTFSACGNYLLAGNSYGQIAIYNLEKILNPKLDDFEYNNNAELIFDVDKDAQICSMATTKSFLVVGTHSEVTGWDWNNIIDLKPTKPAWRIQIPENKRMIDRTDINSLWWNEENDLLYAGCGDNNVYSFNLEEGKMVRSYEGHTDYIHSVHGVNSDIVTASEDGSVRLWDTRSKNTHNKVIPHSDDRLARLDLGKWVGAATLSEDWIICGGGPRLALWQTRLLQVSTVFDLPDHGIHVSYFQEDRIVAGGAAKHLYQLNYSGEIIVEIPVSATTVYSAIYQPSPHKVFTIAGSSSSIDLCTTLNYKDQTLNFK